MRTSRQILALCTLAFAAACGGGEGDAASDASAEATTPAAETRDTAMPPSTSPSDSPQADTGRAAVPPPSTESDTSEAGARALARASAAYESLDALRADFTMELVNPLLRRTTTSRGMLAQRAPDRILLRFTEPDGDVIVGDGTYFWVFYPSISPDQVTRAPAGQAGSGGVDLRAQFVGDPAQRFDWTYEGRETVAGRPADVLTLVPRESAGYRQLKVWIDTDDGLARRFTIEELNGSTRTFDLSSLERNPTLADSLFEFEPPAGVRIVEPPRTN